MAIDLANPQIIPLVLDNPCWRMRCPLDGVNYLWRFNWNEREDRWYFSIYSDAQAALAIGRKVVCNVDLLWRWRNLPGYPPGLLMALDTTGEAGRAPTYHELGRRVEMLYFPLELTPLVVTEPDA